MVPLRRYVSPDSVLGWFASPNSMKCVLTWRHFLFMFFRSLCGSNPDLRLCTPKVDIFNSLQLKGYSKPCRGL